MCGARQGCCEGWGVPARRAVPCFVGWKPRRSAWLGRQGRVRRASGALALRREALWPRGWGPSGLAPGRPVLAPGQRPQGPRALSHPPELLLPVSGSSFPVPPAARQACGSSEPLDSASW